MLLRRSYIISKSFRSYLLATLLTLVIGQVCLTTDGIIMSHLISPDALSAINLMSPFNMVMATIHALLAIGASVLAGQELGGQNTQKARQIFSVSIYSGLVVIVMIAIFCLIFQADLVRILCPEERIQPYLTHYLRMYLFVTPVSLLAVAMKLFVSVDGNPTLVTKAATSEGILNVLFDVVLVRLLGFGIEGSALATGIGQMATLCMMIWAIRSSRCRLGFEFHIPGWFRLLINNMKEGLPTMLGNMVLAFVALGINYIVMDAQGADGVFILSVCMQTMSIAMLALNGCGDTVFSVGSVLMGEKDLQGVKILSRHVFTLTFVFTSVLSLVVLIWPDSLAVLFGAKTDRWLALCRTPLREFSLMLLPVAIVMLSKYLYQLLGYLKFSGILSAGSFVLLPPTLLLLGWLFPQHIWLAFPISAFVSLAGQLVTVVILSKKRKDVHWFTLIPKEEGVTDKLGLSISYNMDDVEKCNSEIFDFIMNQKWSKSVRYRVMLVVEEIVKNISMHAVSHPRPSQYFDLLVFQEENGVVRLIVKDDGVVYDPTKGITPSYTSEQLLTLPVEKIELGLILAKGACSKMTYKTMYGLNVVYVSFYPKGYTPPQDDNNNADNS